MGKKTFFFKAGARNKIFYIVGKIFHFGQGMIFLLVDLWTSDFLSPRGKKGTKSSQLGHSAKE